MRGIVWSIVTCIMLLAGASIAEAGKAKHADAAAVPPQRMEIPIHQTTMPSGVQRYWVDVALDDGEPSKALLDTGSTGLMVFDNGPSPAKPLPRLGRLIAVYGSRDSGIQLNGNISSASIVLGGARSAHKIMLGLATKVRCLTGAAYCDAGKVKFDNYRFADEGVTGLGFRLILGIGMEEGLLPNPLRVFASSWIIMLPEAGATDPGKLILNPSGAELQSFELMHIATAGARRGDGLRGVPGCLTARLSSDTLCGLVSFDTGSPGIMLLTEKDDLYAKLIDGKAYTLSFDGPQLQMEPLAWRFTAPASAFARPGSWRGFFLHGPGIVIGSPAFLNYLVYYDGRGSIMGLKLRPSDLPDDVGHRRPGPSLYPESR